MFKRPDETQAVSRANPRRAWTDEETRWLSAHRGDGADALARALGRSVLAVKVKASRMGVSLARASGGICPICGKYEMRPGTRSARQGMCPVCWELRKAHAMEERAAMAAARRRYDAAKHRLGYERSAAPSLGTGVGDGS